MEYADLAGRFERREQRSDPAGACWQPAPCRTPAIKVRASPAMRAFPARCCAAYAALRRTPTVCCAAPLSAWAFPPRLRQGAEGEPHHRGPCGQRTHRSRACARGRAVPESGPQILVYGVKHPQEAMYMIGLAFFLIGAAHCGRLHCAGLENGLQSAGAG